VAGVTFEDGAVGEFLDDQVDAGLQPSQVLRVWCHTHPGSSPEPSCVDEETFARVFGSCDHAVMFILARGGKSYARLRFNVGPGGDVRVPVAVDYSQPFDASDFDAWGAEFRIKDRVLQLAQARADGEKSKSRTLARRLVKHGEAIFRFLFDPMVPPTNNAAERTVRTAVIDRRITQGSRSLMGRQWNARIWTVLGTCRKQSRSAWQFLQDALSAHYVQTPAPSLLPQRS